MFGQSIVYPSRHKRRQDAARVARGAAEAEKAPDAAGSTPAPEAPEARANGQVTTRHHTDLQRVERPQTRELGKAFLARARMSKDERQHLLERKIQ